MDTVTAAPNRGIERWGGLGAIHYVVLFIIGNFILFHGAPDTSSAPAKLTAWYADSGNQDKVRVGWVLAGLGLFFLIWFVAALRETVLALGGSFLAAVVAIGGAIYATLALAAIAVDMGIRTMSDDTYRHTVYPELIHAADDAGYTLHATGGAGAAAMIFAASIALIRARRSAWLGWFGLLAGLGALFSIAFLPQALVALWLLAAGALLLSWSRVRTV
ncbi:MAG: hypothetical protein QOK32_1063 [Gaiellaceae bacterium]|nr:hypothetical protein [Gaiellaceae bacterium]